MFLRNETLPLLPVQFFSNDDKEMRCIRSRTGWLLSHFIVTGLIQMFFALIYLDLLLYFVLFFLFCPPFRNFIRAIRPNIRLRSYAVEERYFYGMIMLIKEMALIFVYVVLAYFYQWLRLTNNDNGVTSLNFRRWSTEASFAPFLLFGFLCEYYIGCTNVVFDEYQLFYIVAMTIKVPLFILMRCSESEPDFFLDQFQCFVRSKLCKSF
jgi:hypothetical protein